MQLPREPLLTAEMQHLLGEHCDGDAFQLLGMAGHQECRGKFCGGEAQGMPDSGVAQNVSIPTGVIELFYLPPPKGSRNCASAIIPLQSGIFSYATTTTGSVVARQPTTGPTAHTCAQVSAQTASRAAASGSG